MFKTTVTTGLIATFALMTGASAAQFVTSSAEHSAGKGVGYILAQTQGKKRRDDRQDDRGDRQDDRQDDRGDRQDDRQDCKQDEGAVGKDKRDCKQDGRQDRNSDG